MRGSVFSLRQLAALSFLWVLAAVCLVGIVLAECGVRWTVAL